MIKPPETNAEASADDRAQTHRSFSDKWRLNPTVGLEQTLDPKSNFQTWILERNGWQSVEAARDFLRDRTRILDAGCGNGRVTALLATLAPHAEVVGVDLVDLAAARDNTKSFSNVTLRNANLRNSLAHLGLFDLIYCQEVLHHTGDANASFANLIDTLASGGKIAIYVYRVKAPAREYMDDFVRGKIAAMDYEAAMDVCRKITDFGRRLSVVTKEVEIEDIPELGIEGGLFTPQRVLYNFFLKCYWNSALSFEENAVVNYDWYHPQNCSRHTLGEVRSWFSELNLSVDWALQDLYGITMHGRR